VALLVDALSWVCLVGGSLLSIVGGIGLLRFPDFYSRIHAGGVTDTGGAGLIISGLIIHSGATLISAKLVVILFFLLMTSPTATHALAKAALTAGVKPLVEPDLGPEGDGR